MDKKKRSDLYKSKNGGIDPKALRGHRRSIEWKGFRDSEVNKRRNLSEDLTPVKEETKSKRLTKAEIKKEQANDILTRLENYKKKKELKRKLDAQRKKPAFVVSKTRKEQESNIPVPVTIVAGASKRTSRAPAPQPPAPKAKDRAQPPAKAKPQPPAKAKPQPPRPAATATRATRTTRTAPPAREVKKPAPVPTSSRVTRSRAAPVNNRPEPPKATRVTTKVTKPIKSKKQTVKPESPKTPVLNSNITSSRGDLILGYSTVSEFTFNAPFEFKPLTPRSTRKMLGGEDLSPIPWATKRRAPPAGPWCSTPRDATANVASPPISAIPKQIDDGKKRKKAVESSKAGTTEPIMKLTDQMPLSPAQASKRRSTRRSAATTSAATASKDSDSETSQTNKSDDGRRSTRRSVSAAASACDKNAASETEGEAETKPAPRRRSTRRSLSAASSGEDEPKKTQTTKTSSVGSVSDSFATLDANDVNVFTANPVSMTTSDALESIMEEEPEPPAAKVENQSAPANLEKVEVSSFFRTPRSVTKAAHRRTISDVFSLSASAKRTPKALRNSFILRHLSPEEGVEVLKMSPMIEMTRRTPKATSPLTSVSAMPTFDDIDDYVPPPLSPKEPSHETTVEKMDTTEKEELNQHTSSEASVNPDNKQVDPVEPEKAASVTEPEKAVTESENAPVEPEPTAVVTASGSSEASAGTDAPVIHDIPFFRNILVTETDRLNVSCAKWEKIMEENEIPEEVQGDIRTSIGKAHLLIAQRFKQFRGLVDNCEFKTGEKETTCQDLDGFWDMIYFQVEDVDAMFVNLVKLQANNWVKEKPKVVRKKMVKGAKPVAKKPGTAPRSKMAEFIAAKKKKALEEKAAAAAAAAEAEEKTTTAAAAAAPQVVISSPAVPVPQDLALNVRGFVASSPGKSPRNFAKVDTPRKTPRRKSCKVLTPAACTPLMRCVLMNNARKSIGANSIPRPAPRRSSVENEKEATKAGGRRRSSSEQSVRTKSNLSSGGRRQSGQPVVDSSEVKRLSMGDLETEEEKSSTAADTPPTTPVVNTFAGAQSIFTPDASPASSIKGSGSTRRSLRRSVIAMEVDVEENSENYDAFSKYLMPSSAENTQTPAQESFVSPLDNIEDVDMAAKSKRDLASEFDLHSNSAKKRPHSKVPTPDVGESELKENRDITAAALVSPETPTAKLARLRVETPGVRTRRSVSLLFTPPQIVSGPDPEDGTVNLMDFYSPKVNQSATNNSNASPATRKTRRQSRLSLL